MNNNCKSKWNEKRLHIIDETIWPPKIEWSKKTAIVRSKESHLNREISREEFQIFRYFDEQNQFHDAMNGDMN
jgi:hypothetical protein